MGFLDTYEKFTCAVCGKEAKEIDTTVSYLGGAPQQIRLRKGVFPRRRDIPSH